ncbi:CHAT domain-containing tetratricopeptide repeat protein [Aliiglaciecola lipolytica]|uniref:CHAT domain-containing protein n=1 Tax=Aliiglaciecola lipolytica E3 TaxID=1127673 RepID=K6YRC1_9ALTE|nr:CHAT domain-containing tetratricopeptide repeat protein [Aliiglaciecola lipolytica]GAC13835.1 hypothetical protein GLIP_1194 [Aliiglaciecola lipolytica E3]
MVELQKNSSEESRFLFYDRIDSHLSVFTPQKISINSQVKLLDLHAAFASNSSICLYAYMTQDEALENQHLIRYMAAPHPLLISLFELHQKLPTDDTNLKRLFELWRKALVLTTEEEKQFINALWIDTFYRLYKKSNLQLLLIYYSFYLENVSKIDQFEPLTYILLLDIYEFNVEQTSEYLQRLRLARNSDNIAELFMSHILQAMFQLYHAQPQEAKFHLDEIQSLLNNHKLYSSFKVDFWDVLGHWALTNAKFQPVQQAKYNQLALEYETRALELAVKNGNFLKAARISNNIGWILRKQQRLSEALESYSLALLNLDQEEQPLLAVYLYKNLASVHLALGDVESARLFFAQSLLSSETSSFWRINIECQLAFSDFQFDSSARNHSALLGCLRSFYKLLENDQNHVNVNAFLGLSFDILRNTANLDFSLLEAQVQQTLAQSQTVTMNQSVMAKKLLINGFRESNADDKYDYFERAKALSANDENISLSSEIAMEIALHCLSSRPQNCSNDYLNRSISSSLEAMKQVLLQIGTRDLNIHFINRAESFLAKSVDYYAEQGNIDALTNMNLLTQSFNNDVNIRKSMADMTLNRVVEVSESALKLTKPHDHQSAVDYLISKQLGGLKSGGAPADILIDNFINALKNERIRDDFQLNYQVGFDQLSALSNQSVLTFLDGEHWVWLLLQSESHSKLYKIANKAEISKQINQYVTSITHFKSNLDDFEKKLVLRLLPEKSLQFFAENIFIETSSTTNRFPFSTISKYHPKIKSVSILKRLARGSEFKHDERSLATNVVVFANPVNNREQDDWRKDMPDLPWSEQEVEFIAKEFDNTRVTTYIGEQATKSALFNEQSRNANVLHIASHAYFNPTNPAIIGFILSPNRETNRQGFVVYEDIQQSRFNNQLVVLNGCESALGLSSRVWVRSIATAFLQVGAKQTIGTLWPVSDKASAFLMRYFYQELAITQDAPEALANAQNKMRLNPRFKHPFYWAAFTIYSSSTEANVINVKKI